MRWPCVEKVPGSTPATAYLFVARHFHCVKGALWVLDCKDKRVTASYSGAIVHSWLGSTKTRNFPFAYFSSISASS